MIFKRAALAAVFAMAAPAFAHAADPVGQYTIEGVNPGGEGKYSGSATVTKTGDTYQVVWSIGDDNYVGTAIGNDQFFAVSYKSGKNTGLAMYVDKGGNWDGIWTYASGTTIGTEVWTRK